MPAVLKKDAIRLIEAAREFYILALHGIVLPSVVKCRSADCRYSSSIGLLGASIELAIKCCLVQAKGNKYIYNDNSSYKQASRCLEDFQKLIHNRDDDISFVWRDSANKEDFVKEISDHLNRFKGIVVARAGSLHCGYGASYEISLFTAMDVYNFLNLLRESKKINPYIAQLPRPLEPPKDRYSIIEDINSRLITNSDMKQKSRMLQDLYLILPYVPEDEPDWIGRLTKIQISPKKDDLTYLVKNLSKARPIFLYKSEKDGDAIPAKFVKDQPDAISVEPQHIKKVFNNIVDMIRSGSATANGLFNGNMFSPPSFQFTLDLFIHGLSSETIGTYHGEMTAQDAWPFVAAALNENGTTYPIWFIVKSCKELPKLKSLLDKTRSLNCVSAYYLRNLDKIVPAIDAVAKNNMHDDALSLVYYDIEKYSKEASLIKTNLPLFYKTLSISSATLNDVMKSYFESKKSLHEAFEEIKKIQNKNTRNSLSQRILRCSTRSRDVKSLVHLLRTGNCTATEKTLIRKSLKTIDILDCGYFDLFRF